MSRRKSSVLLPFNATVSRIGTSHTENVTYTRNKKTPAKRRRTQVDLREPEIEEEMMEICEDMKGKMWNVYRVSDLNNFNYTKPTTFPRYGRILSRYLVDSFSEAVTLKATLVLKPELQGFEGDDPPVYIKIEDVQLDEPRIVYEGFLLSVDDSHYTKLEGSVHLPVLMARGARVTRDKVHSCLAQLFSSAIHEVVFSPEDMLWMIAAWSSYLTTSKANREVDFLYSLPFRTDTIKCQYPVQFIKNLWSCIHDEKSQVVEFDEVKRFHASLVRHTKQTLGLNLAAVPLVMYKTPDFELHCNGKVKVKTANFVPRILHFIADLCETRSGSDFNAT